MQLNLRVHIGFSKIRFVHFATPQNQMSKSERKQCPELKTNYFQILSLAAYNTCICSSSFFKVYFNIITFRFITYHISVSYPMEPLLMSKASDAHISSTLLPEICLSFQQPSNTEFL